MTEIGSGKEGCGRKLEDRQRGAGKGGQQDRQCVVPHQVVRSVDTVWVGVVDWINSVAEGQD